MSSIPIVDFNICGLNCETLKDEGLEEIGKLLVDALSSYGFVYLKNTGISLDSVAEVNRVTTKFFNSDLKQKQKYARQSSNSNHGYVGNEVESINPKRPGDYKEAFNFTGYLMENPSIPWPDNLSPGFSYVIKDFIEKCRLLSLRVLKVLGIGMKLLDTDHFVKAHSLIHKHGNQTTLRTLFYPPLPETMKPNQIRLGEHSDYGSITLLFQDNIGGLQVEAWDGDYIDATPIPDTVLINIGDLLQFWSNNQLRSTKHRVLNPDDPAKRAKIRRSIAYFVHPDDEVLINEKLPYKEKQQCTAESSVLMKNVTALEYLHERFSLTYD